MRTKWNKRRSRLPQLPRKWRIARNLALVLAVLAVLPWLLDRPMWSSEVILRRLEREALISPSEIVLQKGDAFLTEGEDWVTVAKIEKYSESWKPFQDKRAYICHALPKGELIVVALPNTWDRGWLTVAVTGLPEGAASGELSLVISGVDLAWTEGRVAEEETFTDGANREGDWMFFDLASHGDHPGLDRQCIMDHLWKELHFGYGVDQYPYTLELYDQSGKSLGVYSGNLPPDLHFLRSEIGDL